MATTIRNGLQSKSKASCDQSVVDDLQYWLKVFIHNVPTVHWSTTSERGREVDDDLMDAKWKFDIIKCTGSFHFRH